MVILRMPLVSVSTASPSECPKKGLLVKMLRAFMTVAALTLLAKLVSFLKDREVASSFGISAELDAFVIAFGVHTVVVALLTSGLPEAFLPAYAELLARKPAFRAQRFAIQSALAHLGCLLLLSAVLWLARGPIIAFMASGATADTRADAENSLEHLLPFLLCFGMASLLGAWLRAGKNFALAAAAPMLVPVSILSTLMLAGQQVHVSTLVWSTDIGALLYFLTMAGGVMRYLPLRRKGWWRSCVQQWEPTLTPMLRSVPPYIMAAAVLGSTVLIDQAMAGWLGTGSVSLLSFAEKITSMILALTAVAATETLFPFYADAVAQKDWPALKRQLLQTIGIVITLAIPFVSLLIWQAPLVVKLMFQRGAFTTEHTTAVAEVLRYSALQIPFYIAGILLSKVVVSLQSRWFSLGMATAAMLLNAGMNYILMQTMGVAGIALATAVVNLFCAITLGIYVARRIRAAEEEGRA
jgi:putative peptidoglycan lipid II flippase